MSLFRASTDNDRGNGNNIQQGVYHLISRHSACSDADIQQEAGRTTLVYRYTTPMLPDFAVTVRYTVHSQDALDVTVDWPGLPNQPDMPALGLSFQLDPRLTRVRCYGYGPDENYIDRREGAYLGWHSWNAADGMTRYCKPQESGNRTGVQVVEPGDGELASGLSGKGRMAEPAEIVAFVERLLAEKKKTLCGKRFVVTAGATIEAIDPVRYISNHSSGKMGYAIAGELAARGAEVTLVTGRTALPTPAGVTRCDVLSAEEMYRAATAAFDRADGAVMCAAVADYTPETCADRKLKKGDGELTIRLRRTKDIAAELGSRKGGRVLVGFALETDDEEPLPLLAKREVAARIADKIETLINE